MNKFCLRFLTLLAIALGYSVQVQALECSITATDVNFGQINPFAGTTTDNTGQVDILCTHPAALLLDNTAGVCVYLDGGTSAPSGNFRRMDGTASAKLNYNLYKDAARTQIWGSSTAFPSSGGQRVVITLSAPVGAIDAVGTAVLTNYGRVPSSIAAQQVGPYNSMVNAQAHYSFDDDIPCDGSTGDPSNVDTIMTSAEIEDTCSVDADDMSFSQHTDLQTAIDGVSAIRTICSTGTSYTIALGTGSSATYNVRQMLHSSQPSAHVDYQLYTNSARTQIWGDGTNGTATLDGLGNGGVQGKTVYGQIAAQARPLTGSYSDTIIVTVSY